MADMFTPEKRSQIMSRIRSKDSQAEQIVFKYLRQNNKYFQKHYSKAPGKPDLALPRKKKAVFIDGDFWHGRDFERIVKSRPAGDYWISKILYNVDRDRVQREFLLSEGWNILAVWESDIKRKSTRDNALLSILDFIGS